MPRIFGAPASTYSPPVVLGIIAVGYLLLSGQYEEQSRLMPLLIGRAMLVLASLDIVSRSHTSIGRALLRWLNPAALAEQPHKDSDSWREVLYVLWIAIFAIGLIWIGIFAAVPAFLFFSFTVVGRRQIVQGMILTAAVSATIWALFSLLLGLQLFPGILFGGQL